MITPRLEMLTRHIFGKTVADIGTDHAYIPIKLAEKGISVIASDVSDGPLKAAAENIAKSGNCIELRKGSGLKPFLPGEADTVIIAGMGGELIEKILTESPDVAKSCMLVLQPMNSQEDLRKFLINSDYIIIEEDLAKEGHKIYNLIVTCKKGFVGANDAAGLAYTREIDLHLPPSLYQHKYFNELLAKKEREFTKIYKGLDASKDGDICRKEKYKALLSELMKIKERN